MSVFRHAASRPRCSSRRRSPGGSRHDHAFRLTGQANQGIGEEFEYIIAAVVGGTLLTGGFGSIVGAALGALIIGMSLIGIPFAGWNTDWLYLFLGVILLIAVFVNNFVEGKLSGPADDVTTARVAGNLQVLRERGRPEGHQRGAARRRGAVHPRRQRRRQVESHQDPLRSPPPDEGDSSSTAKQFTSAPRVRRAVSASPPSTKTSR